ncbi:carboxypeptidase-like regulatory domain-containing protein [Flavobacterium sp. RHBU_24]|uniref:carboxypeptidase-like regulatory domain-containing protein n=1 Tax=Flavobacterium sp. RHBU_24 TaxID=3391185 RepID=UPI0039853D8A
MKQWLLYLLLLSGSVHAQVLSGYIYDEAEKKPLEGAYVYLDGTTFSASTDASGLFRISVPHAYNTQLVISYVGFETLRIDNPFQYSKSIKVFLREDATELDEVVITNRSPFTRRQMLRVFRQQFLGRSKAGRSCKIENEDDIYVYYDESTHTLKARCRRPIRVVNKELEYKLAFDLMGFEVAYSTTSLDESRMRKSFFAGTTSFTDIALKGLADKKRKKVYLGSVVHLMHTVGAGDWEKQKFSLYIDRLPAKPQDYFKVTDSLTYKKVTLNDSLITATHPPPKIEGISNLKLPPAYKKLDFTILYNMDTRMQSSINFERLTFYIDRNGLFFPLDAMLFKGYMGTLKAGDLLPTDYVYTP